MLSMNELLTKYARTPASVEGGSDELAAAPPPPAVVLDKEHFRQDLQRLRRTNTISIGTLAAVIAVAFVITLLLINKYTSNATAVASLFGGFGALTVGMTTAIMAAFKVKAQSDILDILSRNLESASFQTIVDVLAKRT